MTIETGVEANKAMVETDFQTIWNEGRYDEETRLVDRDRGPTSVRAGWYPQGDSNP